MTERIRRFIRHELDAFDPLAGALALITGFAITFIASAIAYH